jgi:hypothetical protein
MSYRDPIRENMQTTTELEFKSKLIARKEDLVKKKFNIINHEGPPRRIEANPEFAAARSAKNRGREWHLLSHLKHPDHLKAPTRYADDDSLELLKKPPPRPHFDRDPGREYSVVSGKFHVDHDRKEEEIAEEIRKKCEQKFWKTHDFDFIRTRYYDDKKEEAFQEKREEMKKTHGQKQLSRLPPT